MVLTRSLATPDRRPPRAAGSRRQRPRSRAPLLEPAVWVMGRACVHQTRSHSLRSARSAPVKTVEITLWSPPDARLETRPNGLRTGPCACGWQPWSWTIRAYIKRGADRPRLRVRAPFVRPPHGADWMVGFGSSDCLLRDSAGPFLTMQVRVLCFRAPR